MEDPFREADVVVRALAIDDRQTPMAVQDVPLPDLGPGDVRVKVDAASVNGMDSGVAAGYVWDMMPHKFPVVLGRDFAGTVEAVGDGVSGIKIGDRVAGVVTALDLFVGTMAETVVIDAALVVPVPDGVTSAQASATGLAAVAAVDLIDALQLTADDVVLIAGATGGVGAYALQLAARTGARVLATARPGGPADFVREFGASDAVDYSGDLAAAVRAIAPDGVTAIAHAAGDPATLGALLEPGGRMASVIGATPEQVGRDDVTVTQVLAAASPAKLHQLLDSIAAGTLRAPVTHTYAFTDAADAVRDFSSHKLGKLVISLG